MSTSSRTSATTGASGPRIDYVHPRRDRFVAEVVPVGERIRLGQGDSVVLGSRTVMRRVRQP